MTLQLNVLGGLSLSRGDQPMAGAAAQRKPLALLAVIERAGARGISRERLLSLLAPESDEERARASSSSCSTPSGRTAASRRWWTGCPR